MNSIDLNVEGMSCASCIKHVTQALQPLAGVVEVRVDLPAGRVRVSGELDGAAPRLVDALGAAGYPAELAGPGLQELADHPAKTDKSGTGGCCCR